MSPILGIIASQNYPRITGSYESIATVTVSSAVASVSFTSIPQTYKHLQIRAIARSTRAVTVEGCWIYMNSDTTNSPGSGNYAAHLLTGDGSTAGSTALVPTQGGMAPAIITAANAPASTFGVFICDILDYTDTNKFTTARTLTGEDENGAGRIRLNSGVWRNTAAITTIFMDTQGGGNFDQYSSFALYGIKG